jgi:hypothetical protein
MNKITSGNLGYVGSPNWCSAGHYILWAGDPLFPIPEGTPCSCGLTRVHYEECPLCHHKEMKFVSIKEKEDANQTGD